MNKLLEKSKKRTATSKKRLKAFGETLKTGVSKSYMQYLKKEAKENREIEKNL